MERWYLEGSLRNWVFDNNQIQSIGKCEQHTETLGLTWAAKWEVAHAS